MQYTYTIDDVVDPFGKGAAVYFKKMIFANFESRYIHVKDKIKYGINIKDDVYIIHYKIPSENPYCKDFSYDVVFEFSTDNPDYKNQDSLTYYDIRVYSNSPSFVMRFAYLWNTSNSLVEWLLDKCSKESLKRPPLKTNPNMIMGFEKSLWYAARHMQRNGLLSKTYMGKQKNVSITAIRNNTLSQQQALLARFRNEKQGRVIEKANKKPKNSYDPYNSFLEKKFKDNPDKVEKIKTVISKPKKTDYKIQVKQPIKKLAKRAKSAKSSKRPR